MGRIGSNGCAKIRIAGTDEFLPAYDKRGYVGDQQLDDTNKIRLPTNNGVMDYKGYFHYGGEQEATEGDIDERLKIRHNRNDFEAKTSRHQEGLLFKNALDQPVINLNAPYQTGGQNPLPLGEFSKEEQEYLVGDINVDINFDDTNLDKGAQSLQKTNIPYERDVIPSVLDFIDEDGGKYYKSILNRHSVDNFGSNVVAEEFFKNNDGANQPVGDRSYESLYRQNDGHKTVSNDNIRQQNNFKAKQILGHFSGNPTTTKPINKMRDLFDEEIKSRHFGHRKNEASNEYKRAQQEYKKAEAELKRLQQIYKD